MLSGTIRSLDSFDEDDWRRSNPRFLPDAFDNNLVILAELEGIAAEISASPAQVALAWLLNKRPDYVPIPGTVQISHLEEDVAAVKLLLTPEQMLRLDSISQPVGHHHNEAQTAALDRG
jgi:aryl-alcohol dehydrogenase-like predicted oxidoreductase